jgi:hypothetical protein
MTAQRIWLQNNYCHFAFVPLPQQVKKPADLPNWFITVGDAKTGKSVKLYLQILTKMGEPMPSDPTDAMNTMLLVSTKMKDPEFISQFGELVLNGPLMKAPNESETYRTAKEFVNFFQRRGRNARSVIETTQGKKFNPITLSLENDLLFSTMRSHACFKRNYKSISGTVVILDQTHHFELSHPLFNMSMIMTAGDARKTIISGLRKAFPFITGESSIHGWTFDNQVQGK